MPDTVQVKSREHQDVLNRGFKLDDDDEDVDRKASIRRPSLKGQIPEPNKGRSFR
jgi:hypothetical protein